MARAGRPSKSGRRYKGGKRISAVPYDHGAEHVTAFRARFSGFQGGKAAQQVFDPIGRAWAVDLLENHRFDPAVLRDAGRAYMASRTAAGYALAPTTANYDGEIRRGAGFWGGEDPAGQWHERLDKLLRSAGRAAYDAAWSLCIECQWTPDTNPPWLERLINERLAKAGEPVFGPLSIGGDVETARLAIEGLMAICDGTRAAGASLAA